MSMSMNTIVIIGCTIAAIFCACIAYLHTEDRIPSNIRSRDLEGKIVTLLKTKYGCQDQIVHSVTTDIIKILREEP